MLDDFMAVLLTGCETEKPFGAFHTTMLVLVTSFLVLISLWAGKSRVLIKEGKTHPLILTDKKLRIFLFVCWVIMIILEVLKQMIYAYNGGNWSYSWFVFPFQLCAMPLFTLPFVIFGREGKVRDGCISFLICFSGFAGLVAAYFFADGILCDNVYVNIHTMIHHGFQFALSVFLAVYHKDKLSVSFYFKGVAVFVALSLVAYCLNETVYHFVLQDSQYFNMFYISYHWSSALAVIGPVKETAGFIPYLLLYYFGFMLVAAIMYLIYFLLLRRENPFKREYLFPAVQVQ